MQNFVIKNSAGTTEIDIFGTIGESWFEEGTTMQSIKDKLKGIDSKNININISSLGGDVSHALAIHDIIKMHPSNVTTKVIGATASAGTIIALAGNRVEMSENSLFLVHNAWTVSMGNAEDMRHTADDLDQFDNRLVAIYKKKTGKNISEIKDLMKEERWIDAKEALSFGFIDSIFKPLQAAASITEDEKANILNKFKKEKMDFEQKFNELKAWISDSFQAKEKPADFETQVNAKIGAFETEASNYKAQITDLSENVATIQAAKDALEIEKTTLQAAFDALQIKADKSESDFNALKASKTEINQIVDPKLEAEKAEITPLGSEFLGLLKDSQKATLKNIKK